ADGAVDGDQQVIISAQITGRAYASVTITVTPARWLVTTTGAGAHTGLTWDDACTYEEALGIAQTGDQVWMKAGTYTPPSVNANEYDSFTLKMFVSFYGGFAGTELLLSERDYETNVTILSGVGPTYNAYHVV